MRLIQLTTKLVVEIGTFRWNLLVGWDGMQMADNLFFYSHGVLNGWQIFREQVVATMVVVVVMTLYLRGTLWYRNGYT